MREINVILRGVVLAVVALLTFAGSALAVDIIDVLITPHHISLSEGRSRFVRCYVHTIDFEGESVVYTLGVGCNVIGEDCDDSVDSIRKLQHLHPDDDIMVIWFDLPEVRDMLAGYGETGDVTLTLNITPDAGPVLSGSDTILVTE